MNMQLVNYRHKKQIYVVIVTPKRGVVVWIISVEHVQSETCRIKRLRSFLVLNCLQKVF